MGILGVLTEVFECVNKTIGEEISQEVKQGDCKTFDDECKTEAEQARSAEDMSPECQEKASKCECSLNKKLVELENPTFEERVKPCCSEFEQLESKPMAE